jgi:hypothetical protein
MPLSVGDKLVNTKSSPYRAKVASERCRVDDTKLKRDVAIKDGRTV